VSVPADRLLWRSENRVALPSVIPVKRRLSREWELSKVASGRGPTLSTATESETPRVPLEVPRIDERNSAQHPRRVVRRIPRPQPQSGRTSIRATPASRCGVVRVVFADSLLRADRRAGDDGRRRPFAVSSPLCPPVPVRLRQGCGALWRTLKSEPSSNQRTVVQCPRVGPVAKRARRSVARIHQLSARAGEGLPRLAFTPRSRVETSYNRRRIGTRRRRRLMATCNGRANDCTTTCTAGLRRHLRAERGSLFFAPATTTKPKGKRAGRYLLRDAQCASRAEVCRWAESAFCWMAYLPARCSYPAARRRSQGATQAGSLLRLLGGSVKTVGTNDSNLSVKASAAAPARPRKRSAVSGNTASFV
jgi:hypothetical protein